MESLGNPKESYGNHMKSYGKPNDYVKGIQIGIPVILRNPEESVGILRNPMESLENPLES